MVIYRCSEMCDSCGTCLALPDKYNCGWCQSSSSCEVDDQCSGGRPADEKKNNDWLNRLQTCPNPQINSFEPITGPWEGGTNITIRGINLGKNFSDIYSGVKVAGITCMPYEHLYVDTKQIGCKVDSPGVQDYRKGRIVVQIADYRGESTSDYQFVDPQIEDFEPKTGPVSGGTQVTIFGRYLNAGSKIEAFIDNEPCQILSTDEAKALCKTSPATRELSGKLKMKFDDGRRECVKPELFAYAADPTIEYVTSGPSGQIKSPKGIPAGGIRILVVGTQFHTIRLPRMYVYYQEMKFWSSCVVHSALEMSCESPIIDADQATLDPDRPMRLEYGFHMDDVVSVQNLTRFGGNHNSFELFPNPVYLSFEENLKFFKSEYLTINGKNLDRACKESDVTVKIGDGICNITSLSRQQLTCRPPLEATDSNE